MRTGFSALKYGATIVIMPFSFAYVPELLLIGEWPDIVYSSLLYMTGAIMMAIAIQGIAPIGPRLSMPNRILFGVSAALLVFPANLWIAVAGIALMGSAILMAWFMATRQNNRAVPH